MPHKKQRLSPVTEASGEPHFSAMASFVTTSSFVINKARTSMVDDDVITTKETLIQPLSEIPDETAN